MGMIVSARCDRCGYFTGELLGQGNLYECRDCHTIRSISFPSRRFDMPTCEVCGRKYRRIDHHKIGPDLTTDCPRCHEPALIWAIGMQVLLKSLPESEPTIGEIVHGRIKNTGTIQRLEIQNSYYRGRISRDHPQFPDGIAVEAKILAVSSRSLDVEVLDQIINPYDDESS